MQKRNFFKSPFGIAAIICFAIALVSPFVFFENSSQVKQEITQKIIPTVTISSSQAAEDEQSVQGQTSYLSPTHSAGRSSSEEGSGQAATTTSNVTAPTATSAPQQTHSASSGQADPAKQTFQVTLSVNGSSVGSVTVDEGANQCDVLTKAQEQGKISQLLMKYNNSLGTNGVYQINGQGKDNVVWWVYTVNGTSPTQGCSLVKANSGDTVQWEYTGN